MFVYGQVPGLECKGEERITDDQQSRGRTAEWRLSDAAGDFPNLSSLVLG